MSLAGLILVLASVFAFFLLLLIDALAHGSNPYIGILNYLVAPGFFIFGSLMAIAGALLRRWQLIRETGIVPPLQIDLSRPRDQRLMVFFLAGSVVFLLITALGSYHTYHFTESTTFCGKTCHQVMQPEMTAYLHGPHARVSCTECHIGSGATWYVKSKISGTYQLYATMANKYPRPIPTPVHNLRPAQETCETCHWPKKFVGNLDRTYSHFLTDEKNAPFAVRLLLKVGGADPTHGPVGGIHWHMNVGRKIEYIATDEARQEIPWVRITDPQGGVTEYRSPKFKDDIAKYTIRTMDCMDCHNRPAHNYQSPNTAVDLALNLGRIDSSIPSIKANAVGVLTKDYKDEAEALQNIATTLLKTAPNHPHIREAIIAVQEIYKDNFFPAMKVSWKVYPNNIGHKEWPGCFRCHDDQHASSDGKQQIKSSDCSACHVILGQGSGPELDKLDSHGLKFAHPGGDLEPGAKCNDCHDGTL